MSRTGSDLRHSPATRWPALVAVALSAGRERAGVSDCRSSDLPRGVYLPGRLLVVLRWVTLNGRDGQVLEQFLEKVEKRRDAKFFYSILMGSY